MPEPDTEVEQHLTVNAKGQVWFSALTYEQYELGKGTCRRKRMQIDPAKAQYLLELMGRLEATPMVTTAEATR